MQKYEKSRQKERKQEEKLTPKETQVSKNMRWRSNVKLNGKVRLKCKSVSGAREKIETIASLRLLDEACKWNNLAFFKHIDEGERMSQQPLVPGDLC